MTVLLEGEKFHVPLGRGTWADSDYVSYADYTDASGDWRAFCIAPGIDAAKANSIGVAIQSPSLPGDIAAFRNAYRVELRPKDRLAWDDYIWNGPAYVDEATGMTRRDGPNFYLLQSANLGEWPRSVAIQCQSSITDFCDLIADFDADLEIRVTVEREKSPFVEWPGLLVTARDLFASWRVKGQARAPETG